LWRIFNSVRAFHSDVTSSGSFPAAVELARASGLSRWCGGEGPNRVSQSYCKNLCVKVHALL
jgi:hypothetical protein